MPDAVRRVLAESFGTWPKAAPYARVPEPLVKKAPTVLTFETPDQANAALFGDLALSINDESADYGATAVASFILGETGELAAVEAHPRARRLELRCLLVRRLELVRAQLHA